MVLLRLDSNIMTLNLMKCFISNDSFQWVFPKDGNKPDKSMLEKTEKKKRTHQKIQKI